MKHWKMLFPLLAIWILCACASKEPEQQTAPPESPVTEEVTVHTWISLEAKGMIRSPAGNYYTAVLPQ